MGMGVFPIAFVTLGLPWSVSCTGNIGTGGQDNQQSDNAPGQGSEPTPGTPGTPPPGDDRPDPLGSSPLDWGQGCRVPAARIWRLSPQEAFETVSALVPGGLKGTPAPTLRLRLPGTSSSDARQAGVAVNAVEELLDQAAKIADEIYARRSELLECPSGTPELGCLKQLAVARLAPRLFRRALTAEETSAYEQYATAEYDRAGAASALRQVLTVILTSPQALFRWEQGDPRDTKAVVPLTPSERASALSFFISGAPPDSELRAAAESGALGAPAEVEKQARRLLATPDGARGIIRFFEEYANFDLVPQQAKNSTQFPRFSKAMAADMASEGRMLFSHVLWEGDARLHTLLTADHSVVSPALAGLYGIPSGGSGFQRVALPPAQRRGFLTLAGPMAVLATDTETDIVHRGLYLRDVILCEPLPPPPVGVDIFPPPPDPRLTHRERMNAHSASPTCRACHNLIDPMGFLFENYDAIGAYRTADGARPVDSQGEVVTDGGRVPVGSALELSSLLAGSPRVGQCFVQHLYRYARGEPAAGDDACELKRLNAAFVASGGNIRELVVQVAVGEHFLFRSNASNQEK